MRIEDPSPGREAIWLRVAGGLMVIGFLGCIGAIIQSQSTTDALVQRDALALGQAGVAASVIGTGIYLRYSVTKVLRFWMARVSFDLQERAHQKESDQ